MKILQVRYINALFEKAGDIYGFLLRLAFGTIKCKTESNWWQYLIVQNQKFEDVNFLKKNMAVTIFFE